MERWCTTVGAYQGTVSLCTRLATIGITMALSVGRAAFPEPAEGFERALAASGLPFRRTRFTQNSGAGFAEALEILSSAK